MCQRARARRWTRWPAERRSVRTVAWCIPSWEGAATASAPAGECSAEAGFGPPMLMRPSIGGALFTLHAGVVSPALVGIVPSIEMVIWVAVGGRSSLGGAIAGTLLVNFAKDEVSSALPDLWLYALGLVFILVVTLMPRGVAGAVEDMLRGLRPAMLRGKTAAINAPESKVRLDLSREAVIRYA